MEAECGADSSSGSSPQEVKLPLIHCGNFRIRLLEEDLPAEIKVDVKGQEWGGHSPRV